MATAIVSKNPVGDVYGRLKVIEAFTNEGHIRNKQWRCKCSCGNEITVSKYDVRRGFTQSCGCLKRETTGTRRRTHGRSRTREHRIWRAMRTRCYNPNAGNYSDYGARGIAVCDRWNKSFAAFYEDMGKCPSDKHSIDRIDNNGNYEPGNCHWVTHSEQCRNRRPRRRNNAERT